MTRSYYSIAVALVAAIALATTSFAAPAKAKSQSVVGTLQKIDGQTMTIQTTTGTETVMLMPNAQIKSGAQSVSATDLTSHAGDRVKVRYKVNNGHKEAESVTLSSAKPAQKADAAKPTQTASASVAGTTKTQKK